MSEKIAIRSGELKLGGLIMKVHVLEDGTRIIEEQSMLDFINTLNEGLFNQQDAEEFIKNLNKF